MGPWDCTFGNLGPKVVQELPFSSWKPSVYVNAFKIVYNVSHITPIRIPKDMGIVWETYQKRVPLLGVPGISHDIA